MKLNFFANRGKAAAKSAAAKLRLEYLEDRQMLSATTGADVQALDSLVTENAPIVDNQVEGDQPIDVSELEKEETPLDRFQQIGDDQFISVPVVDNSAEIEGYEDENDYFFRVHAVGSGIYADSDDGYLALGAYQPHVVLETIVDAVSCHHRGVVVANISAVNFEATEFSVLLNGEATDVFSIVDGQLVYNGGLTWNEDGVEVEVTASNGEIEVSDTCLISVNGKLLMTQVEAVPNENTISLDWRAIANASSYRVQYAAYGDSAFTEVVVSADQTTLELELDPNGSYLFRVKALGEGVYLNADWAYASLNWSGSNTLRAVELVDVQTDVRNSGFGTVLSDVLVSGMKAPEYSFLVNDVPSDAFAVENGQLVYVGKLRISNDPYVVKVLASEHGFTVSDSFELTVYGKMPLCDFEAESTLESITLTWQEYAATDKFRVQYKAEGDEAYTEVYVDGPSFALEGLTPDSKYTFRVKALHQDNSSYMTSDWSYVEASTIKPSLAFVETLDSFSFRQRSTVVANFDSVGVDPSSIVIKMNGEPTNAFAVRDNTIVYLGGLSWMEEAVELEISADVAGVSASDSFETIVNGKLLKAAVDVTTETGVTVQWEEVAHARSYRLQYIDSATGETVEVELEPGVRSCTLPLDPNGSYLFRVKGVGSGVYLTSDWSYAALNCEVPKLDSGSLDDTGMLLGNVVSSVQNIASEVVLADVELFGVHTANAEYVVTVNGEETNAIVVRDGKLVYVGKLAVSEENYEIAVTAKCDGHVFTDSFELNVFGKMVMAEIDVEVVGTTIVFSWQEYAQASRYRVQYRPVGSDEFVQVFVDDPNFSIENAQMDVQYEVRVKAVAVANSSFRNSDWSYAYGQMLVPRVQFEQSADVVYTESDPVSIGRVTAIDINEAAYVVTIDGEVTDKILVAEDGAVMYLGGLSAKLGANVKITASNGELEAFDEAVLNVKVKLATPVVDAKVVGDKIVISWTGVENADGYVFEYASANSVGVDLTAESSDYQIESLGDGVYKIVFVGSDGGDLEVGGAALEGDQETDVDMIDLEEVPGFVVPVCPEEDDAGNVDDADDDDYVEDKVIKVVSKALLA